VWKLRCNIIIVALILSSCGANYHLKRAIAKDPTISQVEKVKVDTIVVTETKTLEAKVEFKTDTVLIVEQGGVRTEIEVRHDTIILETICPPDTIKIFKEVEVDKLIYKEKVSTFDQVKFLLLILIILIVIISLTRLLRK
tara:strand:+ start:85 stop:504 length:420 start_codon:yes stop_codon:yes gene_type:complete